MKYKATTILVLGFLVAMSVSYVFAFFENRTSKENRTMATFDMVLNPVRDSISYREEPLERLEAAMSDQIYARDSWLTAYLGIFNFLSNAMNKVFLSDEVNQYTFTTIGNYIEIEDSGYIAAFPSTEIIKEDMIKEHAEQISKIGEMFPELATYVYFVTQADDTGWFDSFLSVEIPDVYEAICSALSSDIGTAELIYSDLEDYKEIHYKSDHHWNHIGARRGYEDIYRLLSRDLQLSEIREPVEEVNISELHGVMYRGSYATSLGELYSGADSFSFYQYNIPMRTVSAIDPVNRTEISLEKIGLYDEYIEGEFKASDDYYIIMHGRSRDEEGELYSDGEYAYVIRNKEPESELNLLICGNSYNRAIRDVLASHFSTTIYFDYRLYDDIPIDWLIEEYGIDVMLISSSKNFWVTDKYLFTFEEEGK